MTERRLNCCSEAHLWIDVPFCAVVKAMNINSADSTDTKAETIPDMTQTCGNAFMVGGGWSESSEYNYLPACPLRQCELYTDFGM
jgi:hypothetical protein